MEYRKLISFGKNSFVVSLPKNWVRQSKLEKGDLIYIEESGSNLVLSKQEINKEVQEKEKVINIDGKTVFSITREVCSAYILNYRTITLRGKEIKTKVKELQGIVQGLMALEILEQNSDSIIAKDFLNMDKVSVNELLRKMDVVTRTMIKEMCSIFEEDTYENLNERDRDVNRLYFLLYRTILYNLENPSKSMKNFKLSPIDLLKYYTLGFYMEAIGDEVKRSARYLRQLKLTAEKQKVIKNMLLELNDYFITTMKAVHNNDMSLALQLSEMKLKFNNQLEELEKDVQKIAYLHNVISKLQRMTTLIHNTGRLIYTLE
ncbi:phosphate uptake regulator PhoU [Candidatus Woesearchaeota archaeon]|nr:phosphate uptake regulator PhoU [Candidatus Woesearchaeota archaeon]